MVWSNRKIILFAIAFTLLGLIRQTAAFGLVLLVINCLLQKNYKILKLIILISLPVAFQIFKSFAYGTPATYDPKELFLDIPINIGLVERLLLSFSLDKYHQLLATTGVLSLSILFFYIAQNMLFKNVKLLIIICVYVVMFWLLFHIIRPSLWGVPRYQLEYITPLVVAGFYSINSFSIWIRRPLSLLFIAINFLFIFNTYSSLGNYKIDYPEFFKGETPYISESIFDTEKAIRKSYFKCQGNFQLGEGVSENFPLVLAGLSVREVSNAFNNTSSAFFKNNSSTFEGTSKICSLELVPGFSPDSFYNKIRNSSTIIKFN